jgi:hypothetical protein
MNPQKPLIGERVQIDETHYVIAGFNIAEGEVRIRAVAVGGRHERIEVSFPLAIKGLIRERTCNTPRSQ